MKEQKRKSKENLIGKIIYGFLLFMPLLAMAITCAYATFNKNAYKSYASNTLNEVTYNQLENNNFSYNQTYYVNTRNIDRTENSNIYLYDFELINTLGFSNQMIEMLNSNDIYRLNWAETGNISIYSIENDVSTWLMALNPETMSLSFNCKLYNLTGVAYKNVYSIEYNNETFISEVFYYSIEKVEQSNLFNWSKDTGMYTTVHGATELLGITNTFIPMLMSYWLLISVIYIVYDIALIGVHMVHNKIHEFENVM